MDIFSKSNSHFHLSSISIDFLKQRVTIVASLKRFHVELSSNSLLITVQDPKRLNKSDKMINLSGLR